MSAETVTERESTLAMALRILQSLRALEGEHADWLSALRAQELLDTAGHYGLEEDSDWLEEAAEHRETVRLYLARQSEEGYQSDYVSEDADPVVQWLESSLDLVTVLHERGSEVEPVGWEILLCYGGPSAGLKLERDGRATVWAAHWSPTERVSGRLDWLANYLEELGL